MSSFYLLPAKAVPCVMYDECKSNSLANLLSNIQRYLNNSVITKTTDNIWYSTIIKGYIQHLSCLYVV